MENRWSNEIRTEDGSFSIRHPEHGECFHSFSGALAEAQLLYTIASGFSARLDGRDRLAVFDVGLGLGYNALATISTWFQHSAPPCIEMVSIEKELDLFHQFRDCQGSWQKEWQTSWLDWTASLTETSEGCFEAEFVHLLNQSRFRWKVLLGDAETKNIPESAPGRGWDFIWQDPFSPKKNPGMWNLAWFQKLRSQSTDNAMLVTYSVARLVKDNLEQAGWSYRLIPANTGKRNWLAATPKPSEIVDGQLQQKTT